MSKPITQDLADDEFLARPLEDAGEDVLEQLFLRSVKPATEWYVGLELELFAFDARTRKSPEYPALAQLLERLGANLSMEPEVDSSRRPMGLRGNGALVSLEPGGQLEYATRPHRGLFDLLSEVEGYVSALRDAGSSQGLRFWAIGHHPFATRRSMPKMPKPRYDIMRRFLAERGERGLDMMHLTCSVQTTVDFMSEINLADKVRTAVRASPFIAALAASSPFSEGRPSGLCSMRSQIWLQTDETRSGVWPEMLDTEGLTPRRYIRRALAAPPMFFIRGGVHRPAAFRSFESYAQSGFEGSTVTVADFVDHLTTFFPEVRIKGYLELRGADCLPPREAVALAGFWRGILDDEATRRAVDARLSAMDYDAVVRLRPSVAREGLDAVSPSGPVREVAAWLVKTAYDRLNASAPDCAQCVVPLVERAERGRSVADDLLERAQKTSIEDALDLCVV